MSLQALLFDLGGVCLDFHFDRALAAWAPHSRLPMAQLRERFAFDEAYCRHETGELPGPDYFAFLRSHLQLDCDLATVQAGWDAVLLDEIGETAALVDVARRQLPCHALSNSNASHFDAIRRRWPQLLPRFDRVWASHEIGCRKPQPQAFRQVLAGMGVPAASVLFFDDLPENVEAARAFGLQAVQVRGPGDVRQALQARGLLA